MRLGFTLRRICTRIERIVRLSVLLLDYFLWYTLYLERFFTKKPKIIKKVLVVHPNGYLGDAINTYCVMNKARKKYKKTEFYFLTTPTFSKLINDPKVFSKEWIAKMENSEAKLPLFDVMIIVGVDPLAFQRIFSFSDYKVGAQTGGIKTFLGFKTFLTKRIYPYFKNTIKERFMYFELAGFKFDDYKMEFPSFKKPQEEAKRLMKRLKIKNSDKIIFFNPGANSSVVARKKGLYPSNKWDRFHKLANLIEFYLKDYKILITGVKEDEFLAKDIIKKTHNKNIRSICGKTSFFGLGELMRAFKKKGYLISINTGTAHLGVAVGIKTIEILRERYHGIYGDNAVSLYASPKVCRGCRRTYCPEGNNVCLNSVSPLQVIKNII